MCGCYYCCFCVHVLQPIAGKARKGAERGVKARKGAERGVKGRKGAERRGKVRKGAKRRGKAHTATNSISLNPVKDTTGKNICINFYQERIWSSFPSFLIYNSLFKIIYDF